MKNAKLNELQARIRIGRRNINNLRDLLDNVKCPNIKTIYVPEEEDKKKGHEKLLRR